MLEAEVCVVSRMKSGKGEWQKGGLKQAVTWQKKSAPVSHICRWAQGRCLRAAKSKVKTWPCRAFRSYIKPSQYTGCCHCYRHQYWCLLFYRLLSNGITAIYSLFASFSGSFSGCILFTVFVWLFHLINHSFLTTKKQENPDKWLRFHFGELTLQYVGFRFAWVAQNLICFLLKDLKIVWLCNFWTPWSPTHRFCNFPFNTVNLLGRWFLVMQPLVMLR